MCFVNTGSTIDAMKKRLFSQVDCQDRGGDKLSRDVFRTVRDDRVTRDDDVQRHTRTSRRLSTCSVDVDDDKENLCYDACRRLDRLMNSDADTCCSRRLKDRHRLSSQFYADDVSLTGCQSCRRADSTRLVRGRRVPDVIRDEHVDALSLTEHVDETSVWSARSNTLPTSLNSVSGGSPQLSRICNLSSVELREQTSTGELVGAFHSTFCYPLHSTLLTAVTTSDSLCSTDLKPQSTSAVQRNDNDNGQNAARSACCSETGRQLGELCARTSDGRVMMSTTTSSASTPQRQRDDTSLEAVRGSPCDDLTSLNTTHDTRPSHYQRHSHCRSKSKSRRRTRRHETGCCDRSRDVYRVHRCRHYRPVDPSSCVHRPRRSRYQTDRASRCTVLPPGVSERKTRVKLVSYCDSVRKRSLVNRLKLLSGCFSDTGYGRDRRIMRTLANV